VLVQLFEHLEDHRSWSCCCCSEMSTVFVEKVSGSFEVDPTKPKSDEISGSVACNSILMMTMTILPAATENE
jgi:hypothetical protein